MSDESQDRLLIEECLNYFFTGLDELDAEIVKQAFHPEARSYSTTPTGLCVYGVSEWDGFIEQAKQDPEHTFARSRARKTILMIDITGTAASAKVRWEFADCTYTDYYNLLKLDGRWQIVGEIYHREGRT